MACWAISAVSGKVRNGILALAKRSPLSPNLISWLSVLTSIMVYFSFSTRSNLSGIILLFSVLVLDLLDGLVARSKHMDSDPGRSVDFACDRMSELIIFSSEPLIFCRFNLWIFLAVVNLYLSILHLKNLRVIILPLRHIFLLFKVLLIIWA